MSANFLQACDAVIAYLEANNATGWPIAYENGDFDPAKSGLNGWLYVEIGELSRGLASIGDIGTRLERGYAELHVWCCAPRGSGDLPRQKAQDINDLFNGEPVPLINITEREIGRGRADGSSKVDQGRWWIVPVIIGFEYDRDGQ